MYFYGTLIAVSIGIYLYKKRQTNKLKDAKRLHRPNWKKDVVYLVQFPVSPYMRSISPFSIKLEGWLILNKIPYENVYSLKFSKKGQIPYVELNGAQIADSNIIINKLTDEFNVSCDDKLSPEEKAVGHAITVMLENHTSQGGFYWRYGFNMAEFSDKLLGNYSKKGTMFFKTLQPYMTRFRTYISGLGRHSMEEVEEFLNKDIEAISRILGDKNFLVGTENMTTFDCAVYGHLAQFMYIPLAIPQKKFIQENCPNIVAYMDRIRDELWPHWSEACEKSCMEGKMGWEHNTVASEE